MVETEARRRRSTILSCTLCRRRKIRCNREKPCSNCRRSRNEACVYEGSDSQRANGSPPQSYDAGRLGHSGVPILPLYRDSTTNDSGRPSSSTVSSPSSSWSRLSAPDSEMPRLKLRLRELETQLSRANVANSSRASTPNPTITETTSSRLGGAMHLHCERSSDQPLVIARSLEHKSRLLGQSHWEVNGLLLIRDILETVEVALRDETSSAWSGMQKCKEMARNIKARRAPEWPTTPSSSNFPARDIADRLVQCYLRTTESIYRIIHIPSFQKDYEAFWLSNTTPDPAFLTQLKLILAIGAVTYDEHFSLRVEALRWVYEGQVWASDPFKLRVDLPSLQNDLLLLIARERVGIGGNLDWISMGAILRKAFYMGLHRDPDRLPHSRSIFAAEIRRRLWNTVIELSLQSSLTSGGAPLISLGDFDTEPPGNFDDDQIMSAQTRLDSLEDFTQTSVAIALRSTFPQRLTVVKFLNDLDSVGTYTETLRLDTELRKAYRILCQRLRACSLSNSSASPSSFEISAVEFLMHRYIASLHIPYLGPALTMSDFTYSRKVVIESSLKIWQAACPIPSSSTAMHNPSGDISSPYFDELPRLVTNSSGFYPVAAIHSAFLIYIEVRTQLQEEMSLYPVPLRPDIASVLSDAKHWCLQVIDSGETNIKGYLLLNMISAQIEGLKQGLGREGMSKLLIETVENVAKKCMPKLQQMMDTTPIQNPSLAAMEAFDHPSSFGLGLPDKLDDWGFMGADPLFNSATSEPMNWMFGGNDEAMGEGLPLW